jgi:hypothetical protein
MWMPVRTLAKMRGGMRVIVGEGTTRALVGTMLVVGMMAPLEGMMGLPQVTMEELPATATATATVMMVEMETMVVEGMRVEMKDR